MAIDWPGPIHWFGLDDPAFATAVAGAFDARWCRACGGTFVYDRRYFGHIGLWRCSGCDRKRQEPATSASDVRLSMDSASFTVGGLGEVSMPLTGVYNVYNALAAIGVCRVLGLPEQAIVSGLAHVAAAFGRQEVLRLEQRTLRLMLCKNPAGANQVLQLLHHVTPEDAPSFASPLLLNDRFADGQDVSWIWDVDYEPLAGRVATCWAGGDRAEDMALRLKYAGWPAPQAVEHDPSALLDRILAGHRSRRRSRGRPDLHRHARPARRAHAPWRGAKVLGVGAVGSVLARGTNRERAARRYVVSHVPDRCELTAPLPPTFSTRPSASNRRP